MQGIGRLILLRLLLLVLLLFLLACLATAEAVEESNDGDESRASRPRRLGKWRHLVAGMAGGMASTICLHPLDMIKIRRQLGSPSASSGVSLASSLLAEWRTRGLLSLYRGLSASLVGSCSSWGLYFLLYELAKSTPPLTSLPSSLAYAASAALAGCSTLLLTNPIWVCKTRMCVELNDAGANDWLISRLIQLFKREGLAGAYSGLVPGLFGVSHACVQFMTYERLRLCHCLPASWLGHLIRAAASKLVATCVTYPYEVMRSRQQQQQRRSGRSRASLLDVCRAVYNAGGWRGFYAGLTPAVARVTPACCITFVVYECLAKWLEAV